MAAGKETSTWAREHVLIAARALLADVARPRDPLSMHEANNCTKAQALIAHIQSLAGSDHVQRDWITARMQDRWGSFWQQMAAFHEMLCIAKLDAALGLAASGEE